MTRNTWLAARAALALLLTVGFYLLAIGIAYGLLWLAYADVVYGRRIHPKVILFAVLGAMAILWSILPRPDKFVAPGPRIPEAAEPDLHKALREVASSTEQQMPAEVYAVADVNAWVAQRGGLMGIGSRRIMGLGLPLMEAVTVQELKAILAHEFGHYHAGDVALGPWIHRTRAALGRTIAQLEGNALQHVFLAYGRLFLRITHAVSRRQEFIADEVAARTAGGAAMASALRKVHAAAPAFSTYWNDELTPVLGSGYLPPIMGGFGRFMQSTVVAAGMASIISDSEAQGTSDPYDTHPSLKERLDALATTPRGAAADNRPATVLFSRLGEWERRVLGTVLDQNWARGLKAVSWDEVIDRVYLPGWRKRVQEQAAILDGLSIGSLPLSSAELARRGAQLVGKDKEPAPEAERSTRMTGFVVTALALLLVDAGWRVEATPGEEFIVRRSESESVRFSDLAGLVTGERQVPLGLPLDLPLALPSRAAAGEA